MKNTILLLALILGSFNNQSSVFANTKNQLFVSVDSTVQVSVYAGTIVSVTLNEVVEINDVEVGNSIDFFVRSNVVVKGNIVIKSGAIAEGWVQKVEKSCDGYCEKITISVENVQAVDGQRIYLRSIPHVVKVNCCSKKDNDPAIIPLGTNMSARFLNNEVISVDCP